MEARYVTEILVQLASTRNFAESYLPKILDRGRPDGMPNVLLDYELRMDWNVLKLRS